MRLRQTRRRNDAPSSDARENTFPNRRTINAAEKKNSTTRSRAAADKSATADTAASCSIARETARRNCCKDSKREFRRAKNIPFENGRADKQKIRNRG